jgi:uncharacterized protein (TIGR03083 family)
MGYEYRQLMWDESADLSATLRELDDREFDTPSVCTGWRVRDVVSHMLLGHTTAAPAMLGKIARYRGNVPKASFELSREYGSAHTPGEIRDAWAAVVRDHTRKGIAKVIPDKEAFVDHLIHHQDIRRPLQRARTIPADRLVAALDAMPTIGGFVGAKKRMAGLRWVATDVDWTWGEGPEVRGPAEALILVASGRPAPLDELTGDGVAELRSRLKPVAA